MPRKPKALVLDSWAVLAYLGGEASAWRQASMPGALFAPPPKEADEAFVEAIVFANKLPSKYHKMVDAPVTQLMKLRKIDPDTGLPGLDFLDGQLLMRNEAALLREDEIKALASYLQGLN